MSQFSAGGGAEVRRGEPTHPTLVRVREVTQTQDEQLSVCHLGRVELSTHSAGMSVQL